MMVRWIVVGLSAPLAILAHEAGHAIAALLQRCAHVAIHWAFTTHDSPGCS
jgi:hypothetical protein